LDQLQKSWFNHGWFTRRSLEKDGFIALAATAYICYKRSIPQRIPPYAVCRYSSARVASQRCPILYYNGRIINKHAVALKALNPKDLKNNDIICYQLFWS
jgi:hypothetical protein